MAAYVGRPEPAQIVFGIWNKSAKCHVTAVVSQALVGRIDAVIEETRPVGIEILQARNRPIHNTSSRGHG